MEREELRELLKGIKTEEELIVMKQSGIYPICGYAPGNYSCICCNCDKHFLGDKRAVQCRECATKLVNNEEL